MFQAIGAAKENEELDFTGQISVRKSENHFLRSNNQNSSNRRAKKKKSPIRGSKRSSILSSSTPQNFFSIQQILSTNFTELCPLFLLKDGIDHRFDLFDSAPELELRQEFRSIEQHFHRKKTSETANTRKIFFDKHFSSTSIKTEFELSFTSTKRTLTNRIT